MRVVVNPRRGCMPLYQTHVILLYANTQNSLPRKYHSAAMVFEVWCILTKDNEQLCYCCCFCCGCCCSLFIATHNNMRTYLATIKIESMKKSKHSRQKFGNRDTLAALQLKRKRECRINILFRCDCVYVCM